METISMIIFLFLQVYWVTKFNKEFIGKELIESHKNKELKIN